MIEHHPYGEFTPKGATGMIIGSFPIAKFSDPRRRHEIKPHEFEFFFGGEKNLLWKLLAGCFGVKIKTRADIVKMLTEHKLGIGDVIKSCRRHDGKSSDSDLYDICWNQDLITVIRKNKIRKLYFTSRQVEKWFNRLFPGTENEFEHVLLISPSAQSARSVVKRTDYLGWKKRNPNKKTFDFILNFYKEVFNNHN
jgi:G:T/U-mismatch repair DNA glycosylase